MQVRDVGHVQRVSRPRSFSPANRRLTVYVILDVQIVSNFTGVRRASTTTMTPSTKPHPLHSATANLPWRSRISCHGMMKRHP